MLTVHHLENSRSQRILWLLEELGAEYELKQYKRDKKTSLAPPALKSIHPIGKSPVLDDDGLVIVETGAIIEHILDQYGDGRLRPSPGTPDFTRYRYWLHAAEGSFAPVMMISLLLNRMATAPMPFFVRPVARRLTQGVRDGYLDHTAKALFDFAEAELGRSEWLAGDQFSAADVIMSFPFEGFAARSDINAYPNIGSFLARIHERSAFQRAVARGGPYGLVR